MGNEEESVRVVELAKKTLQANKDHLDALEAYVQRLEVELERFDKLLEAVDAVDESDLDVGCFVTIPGSVRATAPIASKELLSPESPFHEDALKRSRYQNVSEVCPMKAKELETLAEAVQAESYRRHALDLQKRGSLVLLNTDTQLTHVTRLRDEGVDWNWIAEKVSTIHMTPRTARECEVRWLGEQHPMFNREPWTPEETLNVKSLVAEFINTRPDWVTIAERLGTNRTPLDCMRHATSRKSHQWTTEADQRLLKAVRMYGHNNWHLVARYVSEDATPSQCSSKFQKSLDESIKRTIWTPEEDARLSAAVAAYGSSWVDVAANVPGRHNDQCRDRWIEQIDPSINRSQWSEEEDRLLVHYVREHEGASWKEISEHHRNGRTEAMCRNRYAALQRTNAVPTTSVGVRTNPVAKSSGSAPASSKTFSFKPSVHVTQTPLHTEDNRPEQFVFLEPVVNSNPELHQYHKPQLSRQKTRFKTMTGDTLHSNATTIPPSKKRKTQPPTARSNGPSTSS